MGDTTWQTSKLACIVFLACISKHLMPQPIRARKKARTLLFNNDNHHAELPTSYCLYLFFGADKPRATKLTSNLPENTVTQGQPVKFHCSADGVPSPIYELRFENIFLGDSREGVFVIQKVNSSHQGKYECTPKNILGHGKIATIILNVVGWYKKRKACNFSRSFHRNSVRWIMGDDSCNDQLSAMNHDTT